MQSGVDVSLIHIPVIYGKYQGTLKHGTRQR